MLDISYELFAPKNRKSFAIILLSALRVKITILSMSLRKPFCIWSLLITVKE